jgi:hypothetical protein
VAELGGPGSGRQWGAGKTTVEESLTLDINKLVRDEHICAGAWRRGVLVWTRVRDGEEIASIGYEADLSDSACASIRVRYRSTGRTRDYRIALEATRPNFGGKRWWFICPLTGQRAAKLHLPPNAGMFASRSAYGLGYQIQREDAHGRALSRAQAIRIKLGGDASLFEPFPRKPKGMWRRTYRRYKTVAERSASWSLVGIARRLGIEA